MKRFATAITSPIGVIFSAIGLTADKSWCIFFLVLSIILIVGGIVFLLITRIHQKREIKHEVIAFYSFCIILLAVASNNLYSINRETDEFNQWISEVKSVELKKDAEEEAFLNRNNSKEICSEGVKYLYGTNGYQTDIPKAEKFFSYASYNSYASANIYLGNLYQKGFGGKKDPVMAYKLYLKAVKEGDLDGVFYIESLAEEYDQFKAKKDDDLKVYYDNEEEQNRIIEQINSTSNANNRSWIFNITPSQSAMLEKLSDEGYIYANKLLLACYCAGRDKEKAKKYASRLHEYGYMPDLPDEQYLMLSAMGAISEKSTESLIYDLSQMYNCHLSLVTEDPLRPIKDIYKDYDYCRRQYNSSINLSDKYPDINTLNITQHDKTVIEKYVVRSEEMLNKAISRMEKHIQTFYE